MRRLSIGGKSGTCTVILGGSLSALEEYSGESPIIITDRRVHALHGSSFPRRSHVIEIGTGERNKTLATVERIYRRFLRHEVDRSTFVVGVGGGIVCDVTGFAASTYLRGLPFGFVPTTLLAQADASVGGKNGVNFLGYKNLVGTITQPRFVLCDFALLSSLPVSELRNGLAEIIKSATIGNPKLFAFLEKNVERLHSLKRSAIERAVYDSLVVKSRIVCRDEREGGERRKLNFGHTLGHAIESTQGVPHGEAIALGMRVAARLSVRKGLLDPREAHRLESLLTDLGLPSTMVGNRDALLDAMRKDKKRSDGRLRFVLLESIGKARIAEIGWGEVSALLDEVL